MTFSRRDLPKLLPALALATGNAQEAAIKEKVLPSKAYRYEDLVVKTNGKNHSRAVISGTTHTGYHFDMHMTELGAGEAPHAPHHHEHEEMLMLQTGSLEVTISGKVSKVGAGSTVFVASGEEHGWRNTGTTPAQYFVIAFGRDNA